RAGHARMKPAPFDYVAPKTVAEASAALALDGTTAAAIAGGQSLLPMLNLRVALPDLLVDLGGLQELKEIAATSDKVRIGALTTHAAIEDGKLPEAFGGLMQKVAAKISYRAIRNQRTIVGSVALVDPATAWPRTLFLPTFAEPIKPGASSEDGLRAAIAKDVAAHVPPDDSYLMRLHASTLLRAVSEMQSR